MPSSSEEIGTTVVTGPKISSAATRMFMVASAKTVGSWNQPRPRSPEESFWPPVTSRAPSFLPISTYFETVSRCFSETQGPMSTFGSRPLPTRSAFARAASFSTNSL